MFYTCILLTLYRNVVPFNLMCILILHQEPSVKAAGRSRNPEMLTLTELGRFEELDT